MIGLLEIAQRAMTGDKMTDKEWNMGLFRKLQELEKQYGFDTFTDVPQTASARREWRNQLLDQAEIDDYFQAGIDFLVERGVYCVETHRVISLSEHEIREGLKLVPEQVTIGEGEDARLVQRRRWSGDTSYPIVCGGIHQPIRVDLTPYVPKVFAAIHRVDFMEGFTFRELEGYEIFGPSLEAYAAIR